ncbi:MAG: chemotaxis protein MotB [Peptococcaceae bacterium]|nr:MAG: chemotaxis protein MotB [Peptococcaceae bacterium]
MRQQTEHGGKAGHERWLLTYADLITLLMIFFVVMYALSNVDATKFKAIAETLSKALGGSGGAVLNSPGPSIVVGQSGEVNIKDQADEIKQMEQIKQELMAFIQENNLSAQVSVVSEERGLVVSFQTPVLFALGSADLVPSAAVMIRKVGKILIGTQNYIRVEGHTDNLPINTSKYPSNWELSSARATKVVQELIKGIAFPPERLSATGYGEYRPRMPNNSEANRQLNRRVDLVVLKSKYERSEALPEGGGSVPE